MAATTGVLDTISPLDGMFEGDFGHYFDVGRSALRCIELALLAARKEKPDRILDFGCGFGRVLRALRAAFPDSRLTACDLSSEAVDFCARTFHAEPVLSSEDISRIRIGGQFDLIWCGTLLTNVDWLQFRGFLALFRSLLVPGGALVFTTHGPFVARRLQEGAHNYGLDERLVPRLIDQYQRSGFGYLDYPREVRTRLGLTRYGISVSTPAWVCHEIERLSGSEVLMYTEKAWDNHQDSVAVRSA